MYKCRYQGANKEAKPLQTKTGNQRTLGMPQWEPKKNMKNSSCYVQRLMTCAQFHVVFMNTGNSAAEDGPSLALKAEPVSAPVR